MPTNPATQTQPATPTTPTTEPKPAPGRKPGLWRGRPFPAKVKTPEPKPMPEPALLSRRQAAALLGVGVTRVRDWDNHELMPSPITLPTHRPWEVHWRRDELKAWTIAGCPPRSRWTWEPTRLPTLRQLIEGAERELLILRDQVQRARAELDTLHAAQEAAERARDGRA